ncbi:MULTISPECIES: heme-binding protein [unclassified Mycobacterium]|uniref:heme-binding protein n=1 Tax=unclassified Mycobacterium TaxID=2642494 RepID=UPI003412C0A3
MLLSARTARRAVAGAVGAGSVAGAMLFGALPAASAQPAPPPPNCTAADLAGVAAGVSASTSAYLFTHPDVNNFFTGLEGRPREEIRTEVQKYLDANPVVKGELTSIRQPLVDLKNRCGDTNGDGLADS